MGGTLIQEYPTNWQSKLTRLSDINWRRTNKEWQGVCMQGTDIVNRRQSRNDTASFLKNKMGLLLPPQEEMPTKEIREEIKDEAIGSGDDGNSYYYRYKQQLDNPDSMISRMKKCIKEHKQISYENMTRVMQEQYGYQRLSGSIGACVRVLRGEGYIKGDGRGTNRQLIFLRD
jgi:hypothetical protein